MAWVETESLSFTARHESADSFFAQGTLDRLEDLRLRLEERFEHVPGDVTVVIHDNPAWLNAAHPLLPVVRWAAAPAGRRYLAGWPMAGEMHVLNDEWTERRAAGEGSLNALRGTAERLYVQLVLAANNDQLPPLWTPRRFLRYLRWSWMIEGAAQYFSGQVALFRPAMLTRLRDGGAPRFPPSRRDAMLLGGSVFDLLDETRGPKACELLVSRLRKDGARGNIELAFDAPEREVERAWRTKLALLANPQASGTDAGERPHDRRDDRERDRDPGREPRRRADPR